MSESIEERKDAVEAVDGEADDGNVKLTQILAAALEFHADPQNERKYDRVNDLINAIVVRERLPLMEKDVALAEMLAAIPDEDKDDVASAAIHLELARYFLGLCRYAVNFKIDLNYALLDAAVYDVLEAFGFGAYLKRFCGADYNALCGMLGDAINFRHIDRIVGMASLLTEENLKTFKDAVASLNKELTPERLAQMKAFIAEGDPAWQALKETVTETVVENALLEDLRALSSEEEDSGDGSKK